MKSGVSSQKSGKIRISPSEKKTRHPVAPVKGDDDSQVPGEGESGKPENQGQPCIIIMTNFHI